MKRRLQLVAVLLAALAIAVSAYGPGRFAEATGLRRAAPDATGFVPSPTPLHLTTPSATLTNIESLQANSPLRLSDGTLSPPDTIYARVHIISLESPLSVVQNRGGYQIEINNSGDRPAVAGNPDAIVELWIKAYKFDACITPDFFYKVATDYAGVFGGRLDELLKLITDIFAPIAAGPLGPVGPCLPLISLIPLLQVLIDNGVPLPAELKTGQLDVDIYALKVRSPQGSASFALPVGLLRVLQ